MGPTTTVEPLETWLAPHNTLVPYTAQAEQVSPAIYHPTANTPELGALLQEGSPLASHGSEGLFFATQFYDHERFEGTEAEQEPWAESVVAGRQVDERNSEITEGQGNNAGRHVREGRVTRSS
ncbi:hypothetical protein FRC09_015592, partial [Ceratobasidium sp. 395]